MKKRLSALWLLMAALCMLLALAACNADTTDSDTEETEEATHYTKQLVVLYIKNDVLIARGSLSNTDIYSLSLTDMTDGSTPKVGDTLEVEYSDGILESFPAQFGIIHSQILLEEGEATTDTGVVIDMEDGLLTVEFVSEDGQTSQKTLSMEYDSANWFDEASPQVGDTVQVTSSEDEIYCITVVE